MSTQYIDQPDFFRGLRILSITICSICKNALNKTCPFNQQNTKSSMLTDTWMAPGLLKFRQRKMQQIKKAAKTKKPDHIEAKKKKKINKNIVN